MSHKTEIKTELNNGKYLKTALDKMGFKYEEGNSLQTKGHYGVKEKVDILVTSNGKQSTNKSYGFRKESDGTYTAIGDFYGMRTASGDSVSAKMLKVNCTALSKEAEVNERLSNLMFQVEGGSRKESKQEISFTMQRWVA